MASAGLASMPIELLVHIIATYLTTTDLGSLRLTSKYFERALFDSFAKEFFTKKQFMCTSFSLGALVDISKSALSPFVKHVIIGLEQYSPNPYYGITDLQRLEKYIEGFADQDNLTRNGGDRELLAEAFRNLPNLDTVGIRDYSAHGRVRDADGRARWHSYGSQTILQQTGLAFTSTQLDFASKAFSTLLLALGDANVALSSVEVILRGQNAGLYDRAFFLLPPSLRKLEPVIEGLQSLLLTVNLQHQFPNYKQLLINADASRKLFLGHFLSRAKALRHLRLNFQHRDRFDESPADLLQMLAEPTITILPNLEKLEFGMMSVKPDLLLQIIAKFAPNLRYISLWKVCLRYTQAGHRSPDSKPNPWRNFLTHISKLPNLNLTGMMMGCIDQSDELGSSVIVQFSNRTEEEDEAAPTDEKPPRLNRSREWTGDMSMFLPQAISHLRVRWPDPPVLVVEDEEDEAEENESEDEDEEEDEEMADEDEDEDYDGEE